MRLAISNIAWDTSEDEEVAQLLNRYGIDAIDVAPGKYFPDPANASEGDIARVKARWAGRGMEITGMQALLFGTKGLNLFGPRAVQDAMLEHLAGVCRIGAGLGATRVVFGSPKNRDRSGLSDQGAKDVAASFFGRLGDIAASHGVAICLEPNPTCYGSNFMTTSVDTADVVQHVDHPAVRMQLDTGALTINAEDAAFVLGCFSHLIGHIHASERDLLPLGDADCDHAGIHATLCQYLPGHVVSIEMLATRDEPHVESIERALRAAIEGYRTPPRESS